MSKDDKKNQKLSPEEQLLIEKEKALKLKEAELAKREKELEKRFQALKKRKTTNAEVAAYKSKAERMKEKLAKQKKVTTFIPLEGKEKPGTLYPVQINGYRLNIPKGVYVDLPMQVHELIKESFVQTEEAGKKYRIDLDEKKQVALE